MNPVANIIIIDDDATYRQVLSRSFVRMNCEAQDFATPELAMKAIQSEKSLTVLLDLKLESDSGLLWIEKIRQANPNCQLILLTGYASISTAVEAIKLGADDYLAKPISAREILSHLNSNAQGEVAPIAERPMSIERLEWEHLQKVLKDNGGNISATARALGMHRRTLQRKLAKKPVRN